MVGESNAERVTDILQMFSPGLEAARGGRGRRTRRRLRCTRAATQRVIETA
jgi:hypothetical protein